MIPNKLVTVDGQDDIEFTLAIGARVNREGCTPEPLTVEAVDRVRGMLVLREKGHSTYVCSIGQTHVYTPSRLRVFSFSLNAREHSNKVTASIPFSPIFDLKVRK